MNKQEIIKLLKEIKSERGILGKIEWSIGIPKNNLSGYISGLKEIPKKFLKPLSDYLEKGEYIHKTIELPRDFIGYDKVGIIRADGTIEELKNYEDLPESYQIAWKAIKSMTQDLPNGNVIEYSNVISEIDPKAGDVQLANKILHDKVLEDVVMSGEPTINILKRNLEIEKQIAAVKAEKIPPERNTPLGKKIWEKEQIKRINELKLQMK